MTRRLWRVVLATVWVTQAGCEVPLGSEAELDIDLPSLAGEPEVEAGQPSPIGLPSGLDPVVVEADDLPAAPTGCGFTETTIPVAPEWPTEDCQRQWWGADGVLVQFAERSKSAASLPQPDTLTTYAPDGIALRRMVETPGEFGPVYESLETFTLAPEATLPETYGLPATWSVETNYDSAGRVVERAQDVALDGTVDSLKTWSFSADGQVQQEVHIAGDEVQQLVVYGPHGRVLWQGNDGQYGTQYTYDEAGKLVLVEKVSSSAVVERQYWTEQSPGVPSESVVYVVSDGVETQLASHSWWSYDDSGGLTGFERHYEVYGFLRKQFEEYDALGRRTRYLELTEDDDCHAYDMRLTYWGETDDFVSKLTTCDGNAYEDIQWSYTETGAPLDYRRVHYILSGGPHIDETAWTYDECGALIHMDRQFGSAPKHTETYAWDAQGRIVLKTVEQYDKPAVSTHYEYNAIGQVTRIGETHFDYDPEGRLIEHRAASPLPTWPHPEPPAVRVTFDYLCAAE